MDQQHVGGVQRIGQDIDLFALFGQPGEERRFRACRG